MGEGNDDDNDAIVCFASSKRDSQKVFEEDIAERNFKKKNLITTQRFRAYESTLLIDYTLPRAARERFDT